MKGRLRPVLLIQSLFAALIFLSCSPATDQTINSVSSLTEKIGAVSVAEAASPSRPDLNRPQPKLVLFIVLDQFRADYLMRTASCLLPAKISDKEVGGLRYLMENGAYYPWIEHDVLQAMTGPGHATLATGAYPHSNGIPLNNWFNRETGGLMYCTADGTRQTVGSSPSGPEVGTSPKNLIGTTVGDSLKMSGIPSKVISISIKDRAAILFGGKSADAAIWFDKKAFHWVTSSYYLKEESLPPWIVSLNTAINRQRGDLVIWKLLGRSCGLFDDGDFHFTQTSTFGDPLSLKSPLGIDLTLDAVRSAITTFSLGASKGTDFLAVSFSTPDQVGHDLGPNHRAVEDVVMHLDQALSALFNTVDQSVSGGLENVLIVLTSDHGVATEPDYLRDRRIESARLDEVIIQNQLEHGLMEAFGTPKQGKWVPAVEDFNYYLNREAAKLHNIPTATLAKKAKDILDKEYGISHSFTAQDVAEKRLPPGRLEKQILHTYFPDRSGDVVAIPAPYLMDEEYKTTHITGYTYDTHVPLLMAGPGVRTGVYAQHAEAIDVAPTVSFLLGILPPPLSEGRVLSEMLSVTQFRKSDP